MTTNRVIRAGTVTDFEQALNAMNKELGPRIFATQTHVTMTPSGLEYTAVIFSREQ